MPSSSELPPTPTSTFLVIVLITRGRSSGPALARIWSLNARRKSCWRATAVQVGVGVAVADEVERLVAAELLVAGKEVDRRVAEVAAAVVEVAAVDVEPHAAERVDELVEAAEVDGDQVVDRKPGQLPDGLERALRAALREGAVDAGAEGRLAGAVDLDEEIARKREQRYRLGVGVGPDEHDRVRARRVALAFAGPLVVADDEGGCGLAGQRDVEALRRDLHVRRRCNDCGDALVEPEIRAARSRAHEDEQAPRTPMRGRCGTSPSPIASEAPAGGTW